MLPDNTYNDHLYEIALTLVPNVGPKTARVLLSHFGSAEAIFKASAKELKAVEGIGDVRMASFKDEGIFSKAQEEMEFCIKNGITPLLLNTPQYPKRFLNCDDAPLLLFYKGTADLNTAKVIAVIGTRKNTDYGQRVTEDLIEGLKDVKDVLIVSGLALGIDTFAHKASLKHGLPTVGVLGHSLETIYPYSNKQLANDMLQHGGLLSEFPSGTKPDRQNFPVRNRVVAGMSDITVLVESEVKGGGMITAYVAHSYGREVAAFPGRVYDSKAGGPNHLIRKQIASLINNADDLLELMEWNEGEKKKASVQARLFVDLLPEEQKIIELLQQKDSVHTDDLMLKTGFNSSQLASVLLQMEMRDLIKALPGKCYRVN